jgi:UDP-glucose 4-epimerase
MILLLDKKSRSRVRHVVAIFGVGLIGNAVVCALRENSKFDSELKQFRWAGLKQLREDALLIEKRIDKFLLKDRSADLNNQIAVLWSAGRAGFLADDQEVDAEFGAFRTVVELANRLGHKCHKTRLSFHLVSSIGGLFEGLKNIAHSQPGNPTRPYGQLKLAQEEFLKRSFPESAINIYRPTSVYGYSGPGCRMGLIPTLIRNGMSNRVSRIVGSVSTLRDYVFSGDVGNFIANRLLETPAENGPNLYFLASGKPSNIYEVQQLVEEKLRRRIFISFDSDPVHDNSSDITVSRAALPTSWAPTDLRTGINVVATDMFQYGAIN